MRLNLSVTAFLLQSLFLDMRIDRVEALPGFSVRFASRAQEFSELQAAVQQAAVRYQRRFGSERRVAGVARLQAAQVTVEHALPQIGEGDERGEFLVGERQFFAEQFFGVIVLYRIHGLAQSLPASANDPCRAWEAVEFVQLGAQRAVRQIQVGQLQLAQPLRA